MIDPTAQWQNLLINKREPSTLRIFLKEGDYRYMIQRFEPCTEGEALGHPHGWPGAFMVLSGAYVHTVGYAKSLTDRPHWHMRQVLQKGTIYEMVNPLCWHKVQPTVPTYSIGITGPNYGTPHKFVRTTKGKNLPSVTKECQDEHLKYVYSLMIGMY